MNFLTFVFALLLIFSFGTYVVLEKRSGDRRMRDSYLGHLLANRNILSECESNMYRSLRAIPKETTPYEKKSRKKTPPQINPDCAKLNIFDLVKEGKEKHPLLYQTALSILDNLYGKNLFKERVDKTQFLNVFLKQAQERVASNHFSMEKFSLGSNFQEVYYRMLKGTKNWNVDNPSEYPSILDVIKIDPSPSKICLSHAHQGLLIALLGEKPGKLLFESIYSEDAPPLSQELLEKAYSKAYQIPPSQDVFDLLDTENHSNNNFRKNTLIATDDASGITLRKNIYH